jgi:hypothetical protein
MQLNVTQAPDRWIFASRYAQGYHRYYISYAVRTKEQTLRDHHALRHWITFICFDRKKSLVLRIGDGYIVAQRASGA